MPYVRPPLFVRRIFNPIAMRFGIGGSVALAVPGRRTGRIQRVPVIPVTHDGARYLVSPRGETDWVKNLRRAGSCRLGSEDLRASEVPVDDRGPIITVYRAVAGRAVASFFRTFPDDKDHPVFRLET